MLAIVRVKRSKRCQMLEASGSVVVEAAPFPEWLFHQQFRTFLLVLLIRLSWPLAC
jgi:hypothetical protein